MHPRYGSAMGQNLGNDTGRVVWTELVDGIATITLDSQQNRNALSRQLVAELHEGIDAAERSEERRVGKEC